MLFYASAIIFPLTIIPARFTNLILLNPITQIVQDARAVLIGGDVTTAMSTLEFPLVIIPYITPFIILLVGLRYFNGAAARFAEEV
jgi:lipopolysaccharide transport system permease protein